MLVRGQQLLVWMGQQPSVWMGQQTLAWMDAGCTNTRRVHAVQVRSRVHALSRASYILHLTSYILHLTVATSYIVHLTVARAAERLMDDIVHV